MLKRALCMVVSHKWSRHRYAANEQGDQPEGMYLKCLRCGKIDDETNFPPGTLAGGF